MKLHDLSSSTLYYEQNKCFGIVSNLDYLTPSKFIIDHSSFSLQQSRIIPVTYKDHKITSSVRFIKNREIIIFQFSCDIDLYNKSFVINWKKSDFSCQSCKIKYLSSYNTNQCCSMLDAPLLLFEPKIDNIIISPEDYNEAIRRSKQDFIDLHFSDILDTIII